MSELRQTKKELIEVLDQIPASGSFEGADLAQRVSSLIEKIKELKAKEMHLHSLASAPALAPAGNSGAHESDAGG
jgi:hypothetical protein